MTAKLTAKQQVFVMEYLNDFNATRAAQAAGYSQRTAYSIGQRLLKNVEISQAINSAMTERKNQLIATREQRQQFWTAVMTDTEQDMRSRLRASELLAKSEGDFLEKVQVQDTSVQYDIQAQIRRVMLKMKIDNPIDNHDEAVDAAV